MDTRLASAVQYTTEEQLYVWKSLSVTFIIRHKHTCKCVCVCVEQHMCGRGELRALGEPVSKYLRANLINAGRIHVAPV